MAIGPPGEGGTTLMSEDTQGADTPADGGEQSPERGWFHLPPISFSMVVSVVALSVSVATFYLTRLRAADIAVVPASQIVMWWNGVGGGTSFQWINSRMSLPLIFSNSGAQRSVIREIRLHTQGEAGDHYWSATGPTSAEAGGIFLPFQVDGGSTLLRTVEFRQPGSAHQVLGPGRYRAEMSVRRNLETDWEPLIRFDFEIDRSPDTRLFGQRFGYTLSRMQRLN